MARRVSQYDRVRSLISSLDIPSPWNLRIFVDDIARDRNRPIHLVPFALHHCNQVPYGVCIGRKDDDIIAYSNKTSTYHTEHIILHELGHLLLEHDGVIGSGLKSIVRSIAPDIDPSTVERILGRGSFDDICESEAELFASLVMCHQRVESTSSKLIATFLTA